MSSSAVYDNRHLDLREHEFDPLNIDYKMCSRSDYSYDIVKRYAEAILFQKYFKFNSIAVRYPVVIGETDYTGRLKFYVHHVLSGDPINIDNPDAQMCFIFSDEARKFLAYLVDKDISGAVNGCSKGTISIREILAYISMKTGKIPALSDNGDSAPYNGERTYSLSTDKAEATGFKFSQLKERIFKLINYYIKQYKEA